MIIGHGVDLVEHDSFSKLVLREQAFLERCFTKAEISEGRGNADSVRWFASRFAAKEAVMKALGTGWTQGIAWHEIVTSTCLGGGLGVHLAGTAALIAEQKKILQWFLTISHTQHFSIASIIATDQVNHQRDCPELTGGV